jgi:hypothetical protein
MAHLNTFSGWTITNTAYLSFREPQVQRQLSFPSDRDVPTIVELLLQLKPLMVAVNDAVFIFRPGFA